VATSELLATGLTEETVRSALVREFDEVVVDRQTIDQARLDLAERSYISLLPWRGQFSPELVDVLLDAYSGPEQTLVDPFVGSGTSLLRGSSRRLGGFGADVSMAAVLRARVAEMCNLDEPTREQVLRNARRHVEAVARQRHDLFSPLPESEVVDSEMSLDRLAGIENRLEAMVVANALMIAMGDTGRQCRAADLHAGLDRMEVICRRLPHTDASVLVEAADARALKIPDRSVDLVLTSPPYVNVFNYHQYYRPAVEALGMQPLRHAPHEIGANRKNRGNRFLTVIQYCLDMGMALQEMRRVMRPRGLAILVVGRESNVRGARIFNSSGIYAIALGALGYELASRHERSFISRFGTRIFEDVLVLRPNGQLGSPVDSFSRRVGLELLDRAMSSASTEAKTEIEQAGEMADSIQASPVLSPS
jgi:hypothetical protein